MSSNTNLRKVKFTNPWYYQIDPNDPNGLIINPEFNERLHGTQIKFGFLKEFCFQSGEVCVTTDNGITTWFDPCSDPNFRFIGNEEYYSKRKLRIDYLIDLSENI